MDNNLKKFIISSSVLVVLLFLLITVLRYVYRYFTLHIYNMVLTALILFFTVLSFTIIVAVFSVFIAYKNKYIKAPFAGFVRFCLKLLMPFMTYIYGFSRNNKDVIRKLYIDVNNIVVQSGKHKFSPKQVLLLLPHCLQESECSYKITRDIKNCRQCGRCCIGEVYRLTCETGIRTAVVTGGTAARQIIKDTRPKIILSVACERDLCSGISDVKSIPVIGVVNERPNGPCYNTLVDVEVIKQEIKNMVY